MWMSHLSLLPRFQTLYPPFLRSDTLWFMHLFMSFIALFTLCFVGRCPVRSIVWVWQPRDCVREAYKRIGHAEISNFQT